jgi:hypothetical protein
MAERDIASRGSAARIGAAPARRFVDPLSLTPLYMAMAGLAAISLLFMAFPALDLRFAALFHIDGAFPAARIPELVTLRLLGKDLVVLVCLALLASLGAKLPRPLRPMPIRASHVWFLFSTLAIGPGLIVNGVLKSFWGRPRPIQVDLFGGTAPFEPAWKIGGACLSNCSFVSGEAASAMWLLARLARFFGDVKDKGRLTVASGPSSSRQYHLFRLDQPIAPLAPVPLCGDDTD